MKDKEMLDEEVETIKKKIIKEKGWFVPTIHMKYLEKARTEILED